jgi:hypothetical protein
VHVSAVSISHSKGHVKRLGEIGYKGGFDESFKRVYNPPAWRTQPYRRSQSNGEEIIATRPQVMSVGTVNEP